MRDPERRHARQARQRGERVHDHGGDHGERRRDRGDQRLGDGEADRPRERVDVGRRARDEVAGAGALDGRERQREHAPHEVLAQLGEDLLGEHERRPPREPRDESSARSGRRPARPRACPRGCVVVPFCTDCTSAPSSAGPARPQAAAAPLRAITPARPRRWLRPRRRACARSSRPFRDRKQLVHPSATPRDDLAVARVLAQELAVAALRVRPARPRRARRGRRGRARAGSP